MKNYQTVIELFEEQALANPLKQAVIQDQRTVSYDELNRKANGLAGLLQEKGVGPDGVVAILMDPGIEFIIAVLGILKAGGAYLPIDPEYPGKRIRYILENSGSKILVTGSASRAFESPEREILVLDDYRDLASAEDRPVKVIEASSLAYVIYTSGSTGTPKGVMIPHRALMSYIEWAIKVYLDGEKMDFPLYTSVSFDLTVTSLFTPLASGNSIIVYAGDDKLSLIERVIRENRVGIVKLTPTHLAMIGEMDVSGSVIRKMIVGGENLTRGIAQKARERFDGRVRIFNEYGPTEATVGCMIHEFDPEADLRPSVPIGKAAGHMEIYLLDEALNPVPEGRTGEIYISGEGVASGYLNNPGLTRERFLPDPFRKGKIMYKSGDLARKLPSGDIEFAGRSDFQVKIRGYRIEPEEIESVISRFPGIRETAVIVREDTPGNPVLAAYYTTAGNGGPDPGGILRHLKENLPDYMIPARLVRLEKMPLTANHKIDRNALPAHQPGIKTVGETGRVPSGPTEVRIALIWEDLLKTKPISASSNFFELGGHSLTAAQLILRIRKEFGVELPFRLIFEEPTIEALAIFADRAMTAGHAMRATGAVSRPGTKKEVYPLSSIQNRIWMLENMDKEMTAYNVPLDYLISGDLNVPVLEESLNRMVQRHESFRTVFPVVDGKPVQKILPGLRVDLVLTDLRNEPAEIKKKHVADLSLANAIHRFDLEQGPLFRFELIATGEREYVFLMNSHHLISDAATLGIFFSELTTVYSGLVAGQPVTLPAVGMTYAEYSDWQQEWLGSDECRMQLEYWKKELSGIPQSLQLPTDFRRPKVQTYHGNEFHFEIGGELRKKIFDLGRTHGISLSLPVLAAYGILLSRYSSQEDLVIGVPVSTRNSEEQGSTIGPLINTLPIRFLAGGETTFSAALEQLKTRFFQAMENRDVPFEQLVGELNLVRTPDSSPVYQVLFNFYAHYREDISLPGVTIRMAAGERRSAQFDLTLHVNDRGDRLTCTLEYNTGLFKRETIERLAGHLVTILEGSAARESALVDEIPLLTSSEKKKMLVEWNETGVEYPKDKCIHDIFEEQAQKSPDAVAVEFEQERMTYAELNAKANRLAAWLEEKGAGRNTIVAVFLERSLDLVVSLLAISKTGATYLPLDPIYPKGRLEMILEDARPVLVVSQASLAEKLPANAAGIVDVKDVRSYEGKESKNRSRGDAQLPAYVLYTSGSTGKPKGVLVKQHSVVNLVNSFSRRLGVKKEDVLLAVTTISFDIAELEMYLPLFNGAKVVIATPETAMDPELLKEKLESSGATLFQATPVTFKMLAGSSWKGKPDLKVLLGGEAFPVQLASELLPRCLEVWNGYGPTETSIYSVAGKVTAADTEREGSVPIGRPVDNTRLYVLNPKQVPVPVGIAGELYIGGDGVSPGYLNLPEMTASRFVPDPFGGDPAGRLYRTGDLVRYLPDGNLVFLERADSQVKIRGFRIELAEIETRLSQHEQIAENVVVVRTDGSGEKMLVAYYIPVNGSEPDHRDLRRFLGVKLPDYMIPPVWVRMERFPLTASKKIDKKALPEPQTGVLQTASETEEPRTPTEQKLAEIWRSLLKMDRIGIHDNFFDIGGHSMIAVSLMLRIEKEFGPRLSLGAFFEYSTLEQLAALVDQKKAESRPEPSLSLSLPGEPKAPLNGKKSILRKIFTNQRTDRS